jgi:hypothetical protein
MKKTAVLVMIGLLLTTGNALAQDRRHQNNHAGNRPHEHSHHRNNRINPYYLAPAIIGGGLAYGLYSAPRYYNPPPVTYYVEEKIWDPYCGCYRLVTN